MVISGIFRRISSPIWKKKIFERDFQKEEYTYITMEDKVNLSWHQVTTQEANAYLADSIAISVESM